MPQAPSATEGVTLNVFPPGEGLPLAPSICFICEEAPQNGAIDTFRTFMTPLPTRLTGRKYVCTGCANDLGKAIGLVREDVYLNAINKLIDADERKVQLQLRVEQLEAVHVEMLRDLLAKAQKPARKPAPKVDA